MLHLNAVERLWLDDNGKMNGTIPDSLYNLTQLGKLELSGNAFDGVIKAQIGNLKNLTELGLAHNKFTGTLPSELGLCENLGKHSLHLICILLPCKMSCDVLTLNQLSFSPYSIPSDKH